MSAVFVWLLSGAIAGLVVGVTATWLVMRSRSGEPVALPAPAARPDASLDEPQAGDPELAPEPERELGPDMGRTAEAMLAELERKFEKMRRAEAEQAAKPRRKKPPPG